MTYIKNIYEQDRGRFYIEVLLISVTFLAFIRLQGFLIAYGEKSLQLDFSAFYTAGESLNAGLSPYKNYVETRPEIWDGFNTYKHSRFLYPPLVAEFFRPFTLLPYHTAKYLWIYLSFILILASVFLAFKASDIKMNMQSVLLALLLLFLFHPLIKLLDGQINGITLFLVILGIYLISRKKYEWFAGALFAIAALLKLHNVLLLPFVLLSGERRVLGGFAAGAAIIFAATLILCGPNLTLTYITSEFPRIAVHGEGGTDDMRLDKSVISALGLEDGLTEKDGRTYPFSRRGFHWAEYATLVHTPVGDFIRSFMSEFRLYSSQSIAAVIIFLSFFSFIVLKVWNKKSEIFNNRNNNFMYWQLALLVVPLSAPLTWDSNTIWLIPLLPVLISWQKIFQTSMQRFSFLLISIGMVVIGVPNFSPYPYIVPFGFMKGIGKFQYVIGEIIVFAGLVIFLFYSNKNAKKSKHLRHNESLISDENIPKSNAENNIPKRVKADY